MQITREIAGKVHSGTAEQLDLVEEFKILFEGQKVTFSTERGERIGWVTGYDMSGGGSGSWVLWLNVSYRGRNYPVKASAVRLVPPVTRIWG